MEQLKGWTKTSGLFMRAPEFARCVPCTTGNYNATTHLRVDYSGPAQLLAFHRAGDLAALPPVRQRIFAQPILIRRPGGPRPPARPPRPDRIATGKALQSRPQARADTGGRPCPGLSRLRPARRVQFFPRLLSQAWPPALSIFFHPGVDSPRGASPATSSLAGPHGGSESR